MIYLLSGKLFCGECKNSMVGYCGTGKAGRRYYYYVCNGRRTHVCDMDNIKKEYIEDVVLKYCRSLINDEVLDKLIKGMVKLVKAEYTNSELAILEKQLISVEQKIKNSTAAILECDYESVRKTMYASLDELNKEKADIEIRIAQYTRLQRKVSETDVREFFTDLLNGSYDTLESQRTLIDTLVNRVYIYRDKFVIIMNSGHTTEIPNDKILGEVESKASDICSSLLPNAPPFLSMTNTFCIAQYFVIVYRI